MKTKSLLLTVFFVAIMAQVYSQSQVGTLKIFSELNGITVYLDENKQDNFQEISRIPVGTHYVRIMNKEGLKVYGQVVTIVKDQVTTILIEAPKTPVQPQEKPDDKIKENQVVDKNVSSVQNKTGTLKIFSELTGIVVYLDENKQGDDLREINNVPVGSHYLKVLKDGVSIFSELVTVTENNVTSVLLKNDGQVAEKIMDSKIKEREEYNNSKVEVILSSNSVTQTTGKSTMFPGFYGYYGYSNSNSVTSQISDFKVIQGGVKEIGDISLATLVGNQDILNRNAADNLKQARMVNIGAPLFLGCLLIGGTVFADMLVKKPFLHKVGTTAPDWEVGAATGCIVGCVVGYVVIMGSDKTHPAHYYMVDDAAKDAQAYNKKLKQKLGLPENYDMNR
jgi:PEGA domain